jgi:hypothetical protein
MMEPVLHKAPTERGQYKHRTQPLDIHQYSESELNSRAVLRHVPDDTTFKSLAKLIAYNIKIGLKIGWGQDSTEPG